MTFGSANEERTRKLLDDGRVGVSGHGSMCSYSKRLTHPCVDADITVGSEVSNVRNITIQLLDANGLPINEVTVVDLIVFANANGTAIATTGGSTGIAIGTDGAILATVVAKKYFILSSENDGDIDLTWTDTGTESVALGLRLPNGNIIMTAAFANT